MNEDVVQLDQTSSNLSKNNFTGAQYFDKDVVFKARTQLADFSSLPTTAEDGEIIQVAGQFYVREAGAWLRYLSENDLTDSYTAGENLTAGRLVCLRRYEATWGDGTTETADRDITTTLSALTWVDEEFPTATKGTAPTTPEVGLKYGSNHQRQIFGKIDFTVLPSYTEARKVLLRFYITNAASGAMALALAPCAAAFTESTITWNNKPALLTGPRAGAVVCTGARIPSDDAATADGQSTGYVEFDITDIYRLWSKGDVTNNGFCIFGVNLIAGFNRIVILGGRTVANGGSYNQAPYFSITLLTDNPGSGNTITANDGKAYLASNSSYDRVEHILGVVTNTVSAGGTALVVPFTGGRIVSGYYVKGRDYYLTDTDGTIAALTNGVVTTDKWNIKVGVGVTDGLLIQPDNDLVYIGVNSFIFPSPSATPVSVLIPPQGAKVGLVRWSFTSAAHGGGSTYSGTLELRKDRLTSASWQIYEGTTGSSLYKHSIVVTWATGTTGTVSCALSSTQGGSDVDITGQGVSIYWYK